jgi:DNA-binding beta-propeller fold protein YncE
VDRVIGPTSPYFFNYAGFSMNIGSLALDTTRDYLYVGNGTLILVFHAASMANGDLFTDAKFGPIGNTGSMFLDAANDRLYVGDDVTEVKVFSGASTASGTPTPRRITGMTTPIHGVAVDTANNILYVSNENLTTHQISVFDNADTVTTAAPTRTITPTVSNVNRPVGGISLDTARDVLYVAPGSGGNGIMVFSTASTANGQIAPAKTLTITSATGILSVLVDSVNDRLYAVGSTGHIYLIDAVSTLSTGTASAKDASLSNGAILTAVAVSP